MHRFVPTALSAAALLAVPSAASGQTLATSGGAQPAACPPAVAAAAAVGDSSDDGATTPSAGSGTGGSATTTFAGDSSDPSGGATTPVADKGSEVPASAAQEPQPTPQQPGQEQPGGQQPSPPQGQPQPGAPQEQPGAEQPTGGGGGALPRTGLDALRLAALGVLLLLVGARLRVRARTRKARPGGEPVTADSPHASRAAGHDRETGRSASLERHRPAQEDWQFPGREPAPTGLLPSTASARRAARLGAPDPSLPS